MSDDCSNNWGKSLSVFCKERGLPYHTCEQFKASISELCKPFVLEAIKQSGSDANTYAIMCATGNDPSACLFAVGCYVSGDRNTFGYLSTSNFDMKRNFAVIQKPDMSPTDDDESKMRFMKQIIPLPYYIPFRNDDDGALESLVKLEDACLKEIHSRCMLAKANDRPVKAMFMELVLAGCGAQLRPQFLGRLGRMSERLKVNVIVDEIMTGARNGGGTMLYSMQMPNDFTKMICYTTMGKFPIHGLVLSNTTNKFVQDSAEKRMALASRGDGARLRGLPDPSRDQMLISVMGKWKRIAAMYQKASGRREQFLQHYKLNSNEVWGVGCMIFSAKKVRTSTMAGLNGRYLPKLDPVPFDALKFKGSAGSVAEQEMGIGWYRRCIQGAVEEWLRFSRSATTEDPVDRHVLGYLCRTPSTNKIMKKFKSYTELHEEIVRKQKLAGALRLSDVTRSVSKFTKAELATVMKKQKKRKRVVVGKVVTLPSPVKRSNEDDDDVMVGKREVERDVTSKETQK